MTEQSASRCGQQALSWGWEVTKMNIGVKLLRLSAAQIQRDVAHDSTNLYVKPTLQLKGWVIWYDNIYDGGSTYDSIEITDTSLQSYTISTGIVAGAALSCCRTGVHRVFSHRPSISLSSKQVPQMA
eukprot:548836-Amphidinium_carterae.1